MKKILLIGLCCFDIVNVVPSYPEEDSDNVAEYQFIRRGGNASNSATCLTALLKWRWRQSPSCRVDMTDEYMIEYFGTMAGNSNADFMLQDMSSHGIVFDKIIKYPHSVPVGAAITINSQNGSRTIISKNNNLPELTSDDFKSAYGGEFSSYQWIHAELRRNVSDIIEMIRYIRKNDDTGELTVSLELESERENGHTVLDEDIDYFFVSKDYLRSKGCSTISQSLDTFNQLLKRKDKLITVVIPWGDVGAMAGRIQNGRIVYQTFSPSVPPKDGKVIDTCGAGDSFIAAFIFASTVQRETLEKATQFACKFAGAKCGTHGNSGLDNFEQFLSQ